MSNETPPFRDHPAVRAVIGFGRVPDAVDAAIARHRAAREELQRATGGADAASNADGAAWADLLATRPGDVPGAVRLLRYVSDSPASEVVEDPQDLLRQLLAVVEAAETSERQGDGAPAGAEPQAVAEPDPALAVVAEFRAAWDTLGHAIDAAGTDEVAPEIVEAEGDAYERLKVVRPTTPEGFRALAGAWATVLGGERMGEPGIMRADHAADSLIAGAGVCLPGSTDAPASPGAAVIGPGPDAAIAALAAEFCRAFALNETANRALMAGTGTEEEWRQRHDAVEALMARLEEAEPRTVLGMALKCLAPIGAAAWEIHPEDGPDDMARWHRVGEQFTSAIVAGKLAPLPSALADARSGDAPVSPALAELIARHRELVRQSEAHGSNDTEADPLFDEAWSVFRQACSFPIAGPADLAAKVDLMAAEITEGVERGEISTATHAWNCLRADLLRLRGVELAGAAECTEEAVDWYAPPPGFMASPAIEPFGFALIPHGIAVELGRLRGIAIAEFERRSAAGMTREGEERLRRDLHLDTLSKAARGEGGFGVWPTPGAEAVRIRDWQAEAALHPGFVPFPAHAPRILMDLEGAIRGEARRLLELAEAEVARRRAAYDGFHDPSVWPQVERDLRREMRMDALAVAAGSLPADDGAADPRLRALVTAWEAAERAGNAPGLSDDERAPLIDHASSLLRGLYAFPARTMADICAKLPAFRDEAANTGDAPEAADAEVTLEACALRGLVADLERLTEAGPAGDVGEPVTAAGPDPVLAAIAASRRAEAEMTAFQDAPRGDQPKAWTAREDALCKVQQAARETVWRTVPTTQAGRRALVEYARFQVEVHAGATGIIDNAKALFEEILAPIAAAIQAERPDASSRSVVEDLDAAMLVSAIEAEWSVWASLNGRERDEVGDRTFDASLARRDALLDAAEALPAGTREARHAKALARAWMDWVEDDRPGQSRDAYSFDGRLVFDLHASFKAGERPSTASSVASSDAATLVYRILTTWAALARAEDASDDQASEALLEHRAALLRQAERLPVAREHLVAKALAFAWIGHAHLWRAGQAREDYGIDGRLALDIEATARVPVALGTGPDAESEHDLAGLSVAQLARLYGALEPFEDLLGRAENAPCFWRGDGTERSPDGEIIRQEADRLGQIVRAIADEMERRVPANGDERIDRLNVLVRRAAMLDGLNTDRALLTEALAACEA